MGFPGILPTAAALARWHLRTDPRSDVITRQAEHRVHVSVGSGESQGFYWSLRQQEPAEEEMEVRSLIQQIALEHRRRYGYRRITAELHQQRMQMNRKRVARMMRDDNLLAIQPKRFVVTTNSNHRLEVYLNLASRMKLTSINQLWVPDITYVRLTGEFAHLAVILDGFSRKVVGWAVDRTMMSSRLTVAALERVVANR
jgi:putative transposase